MIVGFKNAIESDYKIDQYTKYMDIVNERNIIFRKQYMIIKRIKHDINNHINTLQHIKNDKKELHNYITNIDNYINAIRQYYKKEN